ncbi:MAG TPA: metabolite traffic protein EboE [Ohtaekwangia sp.]
MHTPFGHLSYCTNIHAGESWADHFSSLQKCIPEVKQKISPGKPFGIGLRLSHEASLELGSGNNLKVFKQWLADNDCYVFTMNGFPYGGFHRVKVKDDVHTPDWTTTARVDYTIRLFNLLSVLLPDQVGGISTSPLSYRHWHDGQKKAEVYKTATENILKVVEHLITLKKYTGKSLHLDIEPEPDGLLETGTEFIAWYRRYLWPAGKQLLKTKLDLTDQAAADALHEHVQLCYDICHFAVGYEDHREVIDQLKKYGIQTGKIQISAALKAPLTLPVENRSSTIEAFQKFNESTYLHQVVARTTSGEFIRYPDLPPALADANNTNVTEWRSHFHVPLFVKDYGAVQSTQEDIVTVLAIQKETPFTQQLEVETYTWEVLPEALKLPITESVVRELNWVVGCLNGKA